MRTLFFLVAFPKIRSAKKVRQNLCIDVCLLSGPSQGFRKGVDSGLISIDPLVRPIKRLAWNANNGLITGNNMVSTHTYLGGGFNPFEKY